jgi:hypothetical protein
VDLLTIYSKVTTYFHSVRVRNGQLEKQIKIFKQCPNET